MIHPIIEEENGPVDDLVAEEMVDIEDTGEMEQPQLIVGVRAGLLNNSNICYFISILQVLVHSGEFYHEFIKSNCEVPLLITNMKKVVDAALPIDNTDLVWQLKPRWWLEDAIGQHQDVVEFLRNLLNKLKNNAVVTEYYNIKLKRVIHCNNCNYTTTTKEESNGGLILSFGNRKVKVSSIILIWIYTNIIFLVILYGWLVPYLNIKKPIKINCISSTGNDHGAETHWRVRAAETL